MSCYHPMKLFDITSVAGLTKNGKSSYKYVPYQVDHIEYNNNNQSFVLCQDSNRGALCDRYLSDYIVVPCGQCLGCRVDYSREWANRMLCELQYHDSSYFVTLTYNDSNVPVSYYGDPETGEALPALTLRKRDLQLFVKRLRYYTGQDIRYYACCEYGGQTFRPHYHLIIFGLKLDDLEFTGKSFEGFFYYRSSLIEKCWTAGFSMVCDVSWQTCAYVARYVTKKATGKSAEVYEQLNIEPERALMSLKPAIGRQYFEDHMDHIYEYDKIHISTIKGGKSFRPPSYFDRLYDIDHHDELQAIKDVRKSMAEHNIDSKLLHTDLSYLELLAVEEQAFRDRIRSLQRTL